MPKKIIVGDIHARVRASRGERGERVYWIAERYTDGRTEHVWSGWATEREAQRELGTRLASDDTTTKAPTADGTVRGLLGFYLGAEVAREDISPHTLAARRVAIRHLTRVLGAVLLDRVSRLTLEHHRDVRLREGAATSVVVLELGTLLSAWRWGRQAGHTPDRDPPQALRVKVVPKRPKDTPKPEQAAALLVRLEGWQRLALLLLAGTGARAGEIGTLTWDRVDLAAATVTVTGKTGTRTIPIARPLVDALTAAPRVSDLVCGVAPATVRQRLGIRLHEVAAEIGLDICVTPHALRRAASTLLIAAGVDAKAYEAIMGHSYRMGLRTYAESSQERERAAVQLARLGYLEEDPPPPPDRPEPGQPARTIRRSARRRRAR